MRQIMMAVALSSCVSGCAHWVRDGMDVAQRDRDEKHCRYEAQRAVGPGYALGIIFGVVGIIGSAASENSINDACMRALGYELERL